MTKYQSLTIYGILMVATGIILIALSYNPSQTMQYSVALTMLFSSAFAFWATYQSRNIPSSMKYHGLHAIGMLVYGIAILFFATDIQKFFGITIFFLLYYGIAEIVFGFQLLMMKQTFISPQGIGIRLFMGFFISLGAIIVLATSYVDQNQAILVSGLVFILSGINLILFKSILKKWHTPPVVVNPEVTMKIPEIG